MPARAWLPRLVPSSDKHSVKVVLEVLICEVMLHAAAKALTRSSAGTPRCDACAAELGVQRAFALYYSLYLALLTPE